MWFAIPNMEFNCSKCGKRLEVYLEDENTLSLGVLENPKDCNNFNYKNDVCVFADGIKPHKTQINITSGKLVIVNYFDKFKDAPEDLEYTRDWSLNYQLGRNNIANYLASQNVAYQQTGNMSVHFWKHKTKNKIVVTDSSFEDEECVEGDTYSNFVKEYQYIGDISCGVWRWMATDINNINEELPEDYITIDLKAGTYELTNYYNSDEDDDLIMATFELKEGN